MIEPVFAFDESRILSGELCVASAKWKAELAVFLGSMVFIKDDLARDVVRILKNGSVTLINGRW